MNILYIITWPESNSEETSRQFYEQLRSSVARGARFPYDCPYEIALVRASDTPDATPPLAGWAVATLANSVAADSIGDTGHTVPKLESWFNQCIPGGIQPGRSIHSAHATHLKLASELRPDYDIIANFGTFVGEPELEIPEKPVESNPAQSIEAETSKAGRGQTLSFAQAVEKLQGTPPPPSVNTVTPRPAISNKVSTCLGLGMMITGVILIPVSLVVAALLAFGVFYTDPSSASTTAQTSVGEFFLYLACCPLPVLVLGVGLVTLGIFIPRWLKETQSLPVAPPKG
jgi:hypothetical protein